MDKTAAPTDCAVNALAKVLFEEMERLAPGVGPHEWNEIEQWERDLHARGVAKMLEARSLVLRALSLADDDDVNGASV